MQSVGKLDGPDPRVETTLDYIFILIVFSIRAAITSLDYIRQLQYDTFDHVDREDKRQAANASCAMANICSMAALYFGFREDSLVNHTDSILYSLWWTNHFVCFLQECV